MTDLPQPEALILICVINKPRDLEIARLLGWYRIPLRSSPKVVAVDYLAFYQTAAFPEEKWRIQYIAAVRGNELTTRLALLQDEPDHPHAHHEYYKIQLGPLVKLATPILEGDWRRITFLYTTGAYLLNAQTLNDLVVHSEERLTLWKALQERATMAQSYLIEPEPEIDAAVLATLLGIYLPDAAQ